MNSPPVASPPHPVVTPEQARDARAAAWSFAFDCFARKTAVEPAPEPDTSHGDAIVENTEEVGHVEQRVD